MKKSEAAQMIQAAIGIQELISLDAVPLGESNAKMYPTTLVGLTLSTAGVYYALICTAGLSAVTVTLKATLTGAGSITSDFYKTYADAVTKKGASASGVGALVTTVAQELSITDLQGEKYCLLKLTVVAAMSAVFTQAEANGL